MALPMTTPPRIVSGQPASLSSDPKDTLYHYRARVTAVHDGDTCTVDIDLGLITWRRGETIRLARINAPELTGETAEAGLRSRDFLRSLVEGKDILLVTVRDQREKYGRYLGELWLDGDGGPRNVNDQLVATGHAAYKKY